MCAMVAMVALAAAALTAIPASAADRQFKMITFNFCGAGDACTNPTSDHRGTANLAAKVNELNAKITAFQPDVVLLQEVCQAQLSTIINFLAGSSWPMGAGTPDYDAQFPTTVVYQGFSIDSARSDCIGIGAPDIHGNAILVPNGVTLSDVTRTDINPHEGFNRMICAVLGDSNSTKACSVHLNANNTAAYPNLKTEEVDEVVAAATNGVGTHPLVIGGDFNIQHDDKLAPANLDAIYDLGGRGIFEEADQCSTRAGDDQTYATGCNAWTKDRGGDADVTLDRKFDFLFLKRAFFNARPSLSTVDVSLYSDHGIYMGVALQCAVSPGACT
jgi:endonuclease/exonuclease/phosphatase family metal-dependent hydrolase